MIDVGRFVAAVVIMTTVTLVVFILIAAVTALVQTWY